MDETTASPAAAAGCDAARDKATNEAASSSVRLLIKSSNQQYDDINIESDLSWTVQRLKKQLSLVYPGKPDILDQKLIYSGKLLDDAQKLSEVIRSYKDVFQQHHIFHLVCANKNIAKVPLKASTMPKDSMTMPARPESEPASELRQRQSAGAAAATVLTQQQQQQEQQQQQATAAAAATYPWAQFWQQNQANQMAATVSANPHILFQQQAMLYSVWMQQVYAQYMQELMQRPPGTGPGSEPAAAAPLLPPSFLQQMPLMVNNFHSARLLNPQPAAAAAQAPVVDAAAVQPAAAAAAGARPLDRPNFPNIQEEPEMHDWLDSFFSFTRLAIFVTVLYFNSSPLRCLLVVLIAGAIYLYHIGVLRRRRERNNNNINRNNANNAGNDADAFAAVQQIQRMMDVAVERDNNDPQAANEPQPVIAAPAVAAAAGQDAPDGAAADAATANPDQAAAAVAAEAVAVEPPNANNSVISVVRTFVITFFTSLLPEAPAL